MSMQPYPGQPYPVSSVLDHAVASHVSTGWAVESRTATMAVMVSGGQANHVLHLLLTLLSCGLWGIMWLLIAATSSTSRISLILNPDGTLTITKH